MKWNVDTLLKGYFHKATVEWGQPAQMLVAVEEMAELTKEIVKNLNRGKENEEEIIEELSDVIIMCLQLTEIYGGQKVEDMINKKLERFKARIDNI